MFIFQTPSFNKDLNAPQKLFTSVILPRLEKPNQMDNMICVMRELDFHGMKRLITSDHQFDICHSTVGCRNNLAKQI